MTNLACIESQNLSYNDQFIRELSLDEIDQVNGSGAPAIAVGAAPALAFLGVYTGMAIVSGFSYNGSDGISFSGQTAWDNFSSGFGMFD